MSSEISELRRELRVLQDEVQRLKVKTDQQSDRIRILEQGCVLEVAEDSFASQGAVQGYSTGSSNKAPPQDQASDWNFRATVAKEIGQFFKDSLEGKLRASGRNRIGLKSQLYIVVRDVRGNTYTDPVKVFRTWKAAKDLVEIDGKPGNSIFIGLPSQREGLIAVAEAGMSESEEDEPARIRSRLVFSGGRIDNNFKVGTLPCGEEGATCSIIGIAELGGRIIVALPHAVWNRKVKARKIPSNSLGKALSVDCATSFEGARETARPEISTKVWVGIISMELEEKVQYLEDAFVTYAFISGNPEEIVYPYGKALVSIADEQFAFMTAESGGGGPGIFKRMEAVETGLSTIQRLLENLQRQQGEEEDPPRQKDRGAERGARSKAIAAPAKRPPLPGLDGGTVAAARAAGVDEEALQEMSRLVGQRQGRLAEPKVLEEIALEDGDALGDPEEEWTKDDPENKKSDLESILDQGGASASSDGSGLGSGRKNAAAHRLLIKAFQENPRLIYESLEANMVADFGVQPTLPGHPGGAPSARAWLSARSRIGNFHNHVRWVWQVAGILDDLVAGNAERARARAALLIAAADQASIDGGSWALSTVSLLEPVPPFQDFSRHSAPQPAEAQSSALYDPRWTEVFLGVLKERDTWNETRKKLSGQRARTEGDPEDKNRPTPGRGVQRLGANQDRAGPLNYFSAGSTDNKHIPGSSVNDINPRAVFLQLIREFFRKGTGLCSFATSSMRKTFVSYQGANKCRNSPHHVWPMPMPYPAACSLDPGTVGDTDLKKIVTNLLVISFNYLDLGRPTRAPDDCLGGNRLNEAQWEQVLRLESFLDAWFEIGILTAETMGRTAGKVEDLERLLSNLRVWKHDHKISDEVGKRRSTECGTFKGPKISTFKQEPLILYVGFTLNPESGCTLPPTTFVKHFKSFRDSFRGVVIDDHVCLSIERRGPDSVKFAPTDGAILADTAQEIYKGVNLIPHEAKAAILDVLEIGIVTVNLLEVIAGWGEAVVSLQTSEPFAKEMSVRWTVFLSITVALLHQWLPIDFVKLLGNAQEQATTTLVQEKLFQAYPKGVSLCIAMSLSAAAGDRPDFVDLDIAGCAKASCSRIGEAINPGPGVGNAEARAARRRGVSLQEVPLVEPKTQSLEQKLWSGFLEWVHEHCSCTGAEQLLQSSVTTSALLKEYGAHLFECGATLSSFRHLITYAQRNYADFRHHAKACWNLVSQWEQLEPLVHRPPLPHKMGEAMAAVALSWHWPRFGLLLLIAFFGIMRIGEVLQLTRADLVLPSDLLSDKKDQLFVKVS
ncbi:unnamed protein product, partial [Symbiodinium sp. KB8]